MKTKKTKGRVIKGYAIFNMKPILPSYTNPAPVMWGLNSVGVSPMMIFSSRKKAEFIKNQPEHAAEVSRGKTKIKIVEIHIK